jgi:hypothetical protein
MEEHLVSRRVRDGWSEMNLAMDREPVHTWSISLVLSDFVGLFVAHALVCFANELCRL